ncbi:hypothetical protein D9619_010344 [Psilocybe cf. subviscida]|uniref:Uncharacterized protein n=1 Tax=Psilocybe cf. subviscida TaxID=2480587 RepID=A0A8H5ERL6_9AGAR|nr:hypothetical protein D9619_010344 [Psilocybe cf. subviscida]
MSGNEAGLRTSPPRSSPSLKPPPPPPPPPCLRKGAEHGGHYAPSCFALKSNAAATLVSPRLAECRRRLSQPTTTHTHTRIATPFLETGSGRASLVARILVSSLLPTMTPLTRRWSSAYQSLLNFFPAADTCVVLPLPIALSTGTISMRVLVLLLSRTPARALVRAEPGSTIAPTLAMMYHGPRRVQGHRRQPPTPRVNLCDQPQTGSIANLRGASAGAETRAA